FLRLGESGRIANLPDVQLHYRQHCDSVNRIRHQKQAELVTQVVHEAARRRGIGLSSEWKYQSQPPPAPRDQLREWGWRALRENRIEVARKHAKSLLRMNPLGLESWRLMMC